jgi:hypothetical protein
MSNNIMSPDYGDMQQLTERHMLSGSIPFNKRFDPNGPYEKAFEMGGWDNMIEDLKKKKREQQGNVALPILSRMLSNVPNYLKFAEKNGPFSITARPWENY